MSAKHELDRFRSIRAPAMPRARVTLDPEGWPLVAGKYGRLEWRGQGPTGACRVYAYTDRPKMIAKLRAVSGARPVQTGDHEAAFSVEAQDVGAIKALAALLKLRTRRAPEMGRSAAELARTGFKPGDERHFSRQEAAPVTSAA